MYDVIIDVSVFYTLMDTLNIFLKIVFYLIATAFTAKKVKVNFRSPSAVLSQTDTAVCILTIKFLGSRLGRTIKGQNELKAWDGLFSL